MSSFNCVSKRQRIGRFLVAEFVEEAPEGDAGMVVELVDHFGQFLPRARHVFGRVVDRIHVGNFVPHEQAVAVGEIVPALGSADNGCCERRSHPFPVIRRASSS